MSNVLAATMMWVAAGWIAQSPPPPAAGPGQRLERRPAAETIRRTLDRDRPSADPIPGQVPLELAAAGRQDGTASGLWPEGFLLARRRGQLRRTDDGWAFVIVEGEDQGNAIRVLPNSKLRQMQAYTSDGTRAVDFTVSGMVTEYADENYLLIRNAVVLSGGSQPPTVRARPRTDDASGSGDVLDLIRSDALLGRPVPTTLPEAGPDPARIPPSVAPGEEFAKLLPEESTVTLRTGRLVAEMDGPVLAFESDSDRPAEPPLAVLASLARQQMEAYAQGGLRSVVFVVSGEITAYQGRNYLLVRRFFVRPDDGNLK